MAPRSRLAPTGNDESRHVQAAAASDSSPPSTALRLGIATAFRHMSDSMDDIQAIALQFRVSFSDNNIKMLSLEHIQHELNLLALTARQVHLLLNSYSDTVSADIERLSAGLSIVPIPESRDQLALSAAALQVLVEEPSSPATALTAQDETTASEQSLETVQQAAIFGYFPAPSQTSGPRQLDFSDICKDPALLGRSSMTKNISCDYTVNHWYCRWCAQPVSNPVQHERNCDLNPLDPPRYKFKTEICEFCKYRIPSQFSEAHLDTCVYNGAQYHASKPVRQEVEILTKESIEAQIDAGQENPAYLSRACYRCSDNGMESSCDRIFGCQNCRNKFKMCEYEFGGATIAFDCDMPSLNITHNHLRLPETKKSCRECNENEEPCVNDGYGPCKHCLEHNKEFCEYAVDDPDFTWSTPFLRRFHTRGCAVNNNTNNKLEEIFKQRQAIEIVEQHFADAVAESAVGKRKRAEGVEQSDASAEGVSTRKQKKTK